MSWLIVISCAYFLLALVSLGDKRILAGPVNAKTYTFYIGVLGILALLLIPVAEFSFPVPAQILICLFSGLVYILANLFFLSGLERFETSRIVTAIGGFLPLFTFFLSFVVFGQKEVLELKEIFAFALLILGSILASWESPLEFSLSSLRFSLPSAFFFAAFFVIAKYVYLQQQFWNGFIWMRIGAFAVALLLLIPKGIRKDIFGGKPKFSRETAIFFVVVQAGGALAFILQNLAVKMAGISYLPIINALQGIQYAFLFVFAVFLSLKMPKIVREKISRRVIIQKSAAILFIAIGLAILALGKNA